MAWPKPMPIVEVEWVDSTSHGSWSTPELYQDRIRGYGLLCRSAGYLFAKDRERVVVLQSQGLSGNICDAMQIPRSAVRSIRVIEKPKRSKQ